MDEMPQADQCIRVFLLGSQSIFGNGIKNLLSREPYLEIVGYEDASEKAIEHIKELVPDAVIIVGNGSPEIVLNILHGSVDVKVIHLNLENNTICIYHGEQRKVKGIQDLLLAIR